MANSVFEIKHAKKTYLANGFPVAMIKRNTLSGGDDVVNTDKYAVKVSIDEVAKPTWIQWGQELTPIKPGQQFVISVFIKAQDVKGRTGFYVHVYDANHKALINQVWTVETPTFDWKQ